MAVSELRRLAVLQECDLLGRPVEGELSGLVRVAAAVAGVPTASLNLLDETRQCQLTTVGFEGRTTPRAQSMCAVRFDAGVPVHVPDARRSPDYADNPWVTGELGTVRCYVSYPLITPDGFALGTLCVFDVVERTMSADQLDRLQDIAGAVVALIERRRQARRVAELAVEAETQRAQHSLAAHELEIARDALASRSRELERSNAELSEFAAVASHDLRSPLAVIDGYLGLLLDVYGAGLEERACDWVRVARTAVGRMLSLTEALLVYAQAGAGSCPREPVALSDVLGHVLDDLEADLSRVGAQVVAESLPVVDADPVLMRQLLQNLLANAIAHRDPERPCLVHVSAVESDGGWTVTVADHGRGVPLEYRERVFAMFTRVDPSSRAGSGIGLATCARIVDGHGGRIWIEETPGGGATVRFTLGVGALVG